MIANISYLLVIKAALFCLMIRIEALTPLSIENECLDQLNIVASFVSRQNYSELLEAKRVVEELVANLLINPSYILGQGMPEGFRKIKLGQDEKEELALTLALGKVKKCYANGRRKSLKNWPRRTKRQEGGSKREGKSGKEGGEGKSKQEGTSGKKNGGGGGGGSSKQVAGGSSKSKIEGGPKTVMGVRTVGKVYQIVIHVVAGITALAVGCASGAVSALFGCFAGIFGCAYGLARKQDPEALLDPFKGCAAWWVGGFLAGGYVTLVVVETTLTLGNPYMDFDQLEAQAKEIKKKVDKATIKAESGQK